MDAFTMARIKTRIRKIESLRDAIEKEKIAYKNCVIRRKSAANATIINEI